MVTYLEPTLVKKCNPLRATIFQVFLLFIICSLLPSIAQAQSLAQQLYARFNDDIYRIDVITKSSDSKASLGTGFVVADGKTLATNFHVISAAVNEPELYKLEWESVDGRRGPLKVLAVDVVHDLALVTAAEEMGEPMITASLPEKGASLFSLGHPLGLDLAIITGTANGLLEKAIYKKIHFSGNINPGMSGGPAIDEAGLVIGVNVASAGEAVGFLVPANFLDELLLRSEKFLTVNSEVVTVGIAAEGNVKEEAVTEEAIRESIRQQLLANQAQLFDEIFDGDWETHQVGSFVVPDKISTRLDCWGNSQPEEDKRKFSEVDSNCMSQDSIYLSGRQRAGAISYQYFWIESEQLSPRSFYSFYERRNNSTFMGGPNEKDVGNFTCSTDFIEVAGQAFKANVCARPYLNYPELVDFMVLVAMTGHENKGFLYTLDLSTVTLTNAMSLYQRFLESFTWQP